MNKLFLIVLITVFTLQLQAQEPKHKDKRAFFKDLSVEQIADLKTKKMTLLLDLTNAQQDKVYKLNLNLATERKEKMAKKEKRDVTKKLSSDKHYSNLTKRIDRQIAIKKEMKSILNEKQYEKWEKTQQRRHRKGKMKKSRMRKEK